MKTVRFLTEIGSNYIFHLLALSGAWGRSQYREKYLTSLYPADLQLLQQFRELLAFGAATSGRLTALCVFLPSYLNLACPLDIRQYFDLLELGFATGSFQAFLDQYQAAVKSLDSWVQPISAQWLGSHSPERTALLRLAGVYVRNLPRYLSDVWPFEQSSMASIVAELQSRFDSWPIIEKWEKITGSRWKSDHYDILLCSALQGGPTANSVGYERNTFYFEHDARWLMDFISHEIGTHILIDISIDLYKRFPTGSLVYRAHECLAQYYNREVLSRPLNYSLPPSYDYDRLSRLYHELRDKRPAISPHELQSAGLSRLMAERRTE